MHQAEKDYSRIGSDLGFVKFDNFWLWEKRVKIYLYPDKISFINAVGAPKWAVGKANYRKKEIAGIERSDAFLGSVLPHEIAHLVFRDFTGFGDDIPLWLDEGVAQWEDDVGRVKARNIAHLLHKKNRLMSVLDLAAMDVRKVNETGAAAEFYAQAVSIVGFMVEEYGSERFVGFCRKLRDGKTVDDALRFTYQGRISSIGELERKWKKSLEVE